MNKSILWLSACLCNIMGMGQDNPKKPNIIFFLVDDMGWQETSVPFWTSRTLLNDRYHTPNMESLAAMGVKFTQAYACPLSSPTRVSLMTGMNAARHQVTNWTLRKDKSPDVIHPELNIPEWNMNGISPVPGIGSTLHVNTLPMILREAGYTTIHVGKAHWGAKGTPGEDPLNLGFDVNIAGHAPGGPGSYLGKYNFSAEWRHEDRIWDVPGLEKYFGQDIYLTEALTIEALDQMEKASKLERPFYLYMSHYAIHAPWEKDDRYYQKYRDRGLTDFEATYASMIEGMDKSLGDILMKVKELGIDSNTIIIFMSDNGSPRQCPANLPLRGHKITPYEGGIRDPMIVKWPGVTAAGTVCDDPLIIEDFFPSILEMAGVKKYRQLAGPIDGQSFVPMLRRKHTDTGKRQFIWHFPHNYDQEPYSVIRRGDWKLIYWYKTGKRELYNIRKDISETSDLAMVQPGITNDLAARLGKYLREVQAGRPSYKESGKACRWPDGIE
jgi:arylsulfatase A-like enzyme